MAITKLMHMKEHKGITKGSHLQHAIKYILNPKKTAGGLYVNSNCGYDVEEIYKSMLETKQQFGKEWGRQGYHFILSFLPGEATEEVAYRTAGEFVDRYLMDGYDYVYAVHNDKGHIHTHIIFNSVSYDGYKYHCGKDEWKEHIQPVTDALCREQGLSTILMKEGGKSKSYGEWLAEKEGKMTWRKAIRLDLDAAVRECGTYQELIAIMQQNGYEIRQGNSRKHGVYLSIRPPGSKKAFRTYTLGSEYQVSELKKRVNIEHHTKRITLPPRLKTFRIPSNIRLLTASVYQLNHFRRYYQARHFYNYRGLQYRKDIRQIEQLSRQCNYILKNGIQGPEVLEKRIEEVKYQERELYRYRKELEIRKKVGKDWEDLDGIVEVKLAESNARLQQLRSEKRLLGKIQEQDQEGIEPVFQKEKDTFRLVSIIDRR